MSNPTDTLEPPRARRPGFTLIELLVVVAIIALLTSIVSPSFVSIRRRTRSTVCLSNLHALGRAMHAYHAFSNDRFWPYRLDNWPKTGNRCYWWGTDADPVDPSASPFMEAAGGKLNLLWCPTMPWGSYTPQGWYVSEPTTTYGYNAHYLDPTLNGTQARKLTDVKLPARLFVFNDSAMFWTVMGRDIFQNSTYLEPVSGNWVQQPTSHFRHSGKTNALTADGHAASYEPEGWDLDPAHDLGFVGTRNYPHYAQ